MGLVTGNDNDNGNFSANELGIPMTTQPLVTVGMPIRNGGEFLSAALDSILAQSYTNLQVIVSDNCSDDQTAATIEKYRVRDPRLVCVRQGQPLKAIENFRFVLKEAQGEFFMWAAHDDVHSVDYIEKLVGGLSADPTALLAFGDLLITGSSDGRAVPKVYDFATEGLTWRARMRKAAFTQCFHIYGVWRTSDLRRIPSPSNVWWPDLPIMLAAAKMGPCKYVAGPRFYYYEVPKTNLQRVQYQDYKAGFSLLGGVLGLIGSAYSVVAAVSGRGAGVWGAWLVAEKQLRALPGFLGRRLAWLVAR